MFVRKLVKILASSSVRNLHTTTTRWKNRGENPIWRTFRILRDDLLSLQPPSEAETEKSRALMGFYPNHADIVIVGGAAIGSSIAYWLKQKTSRTGLRIVVLEKDMSYSKCSTVLSVGGLRQQFSLPENIQMSCFGAEFLKNIKDRFGPEADVFFTPHGYLILASESGAQTLIDNSALQKDFGAINTILSKQQLSERFPWMNVDDVEVGCLGLEREGWFDAWSLLMLLRRGAAQLGAQYIQAEVVDFLFKQRDHVMIDGEEAGSYDSTNELVLKLPNGEHRTMEFAYCIVAAGAESGDIAKLARIGTGDGMLSVPLPVERRKRYAYQFQCSEKPPALNAPMTIDHTGAYFRRDGLGGSFIAGLSPGNEHEPSTDNLDVDYEFFDQQVWPKLAHRVPAFNSIKVKHAWAGFYDYNCFDENGVIGPHPCYGNLYFATGFSGHGIQQAPAVGRAVAELILDGDFKTIDLSRFGFDRILVDKPMCEIGIY